MRIRRIAFAWLGWLASERLWRHLPHKHTGYVALAGNEWPCGICGLTPRETGATAPGYSWERMHGKVVLVTPEDSWYVPLPDYRRHPQSNYP